MRILQLLVLFTFIFSGPAHAGEKLEMGAAPAWAIRDNSIARLTAAKADGGMQILLTEQQVKITPVAVITYARQLIRINDSAGMEAGNLSFSWRPALDQVTIHGLRILRGKEVIDVLAGGQSFAILRREANMESAMLDGVLTANMQPEGLQVGDVLDLELSIRTADPLFTGHPELSLMLPDVAAVSQTVSVEWPSDMHLSSRISPSLPSPAQTTRNGVTRLAINRANVVAREAPSSAPLRFSLPPSVDVTGFTDWSEVGRLMAPLYAKAATIPATGPLRAELEKIRSAGGDKMTQALAATTLVQSRTRYVALLMGDGGYVPADAATTWSRRFGDCKAKTALLLGLLNELHISAVPIAVNTVAGDVIEGRLPRIGLFNHVLIRATIDGRELWLDGTRSGDNRPEHFTVPFYRWGLELAANNAKLVPMVPAVPAIPTTEYLIDFDASAGLELPAKARLTAIYRGRSAVDLNALLLTASAAQRDQILRAFWAARHPSVKPSTVSATMDPRSGELRLVLDGTADLEWKGGHYEADVAVGRRLNVERKAGPNADAPIANPYPFFERTHQTIRLPAEFAKSPPSYPVVALTLAGIEYRRSAGITGTVFTADGSERSLVPEVSLAEAKKASEQLKTLADEVMYVVVPSGYALSERGVAQLKKLELSDVDDLIDRGVKLLNAYRFDDALKDFDAAATKNPRSVWALANRGMTRVWLQQYPQAEKDFAAAALIDPRNPVLLRGQGLLSLQRKQWRQSIDFFGQAIEVEPESEFARINRAQAYSAMGDLDHAISEADTVLARHPKSAEMHLFRGQLLAVRGDREVAAADLAALAGPDADHEQLLLATRLARQLEHYDEMLKLYDRAIALQPDHAIFLARATSRPVRDVEGRRSDLKAYLQKEPTSPEGIGLMGELLEGSGDNAGAVKLYTRGIAALSEGYRLKTRRGIALTRLGRTAEAAQDFKADLPADPTSAHFNNRCWDLGRAGVRLDAALASCDRALKMKPGSGAAFDSRALVHYRLGNYDRAIADCNAAIEDGPKATSYYVRSLSRARKGDAAGASADRKLAIAYDPDIVARFGSFGIGSPSPE